MMLIRVPCPSCGKALKVDQKFAGRKGICPACKSKIQIPDPDEKKIDEDDILDLLGPASEKRPSYAARKDDLPVHQDPKHDDGQGSAEDSTLTGGSSVLQRALRKCPVCAKEISPRYTICPHCRTYLVESGEVKPSASVKCPTCGVPSFPGASVCNQCGTRLIVEE